ncbi:uncharacterized protein C7orf50 homolog [Ochotona princeps]|uniref:uncharacterized protein C7orf50 homolog n=1 Tax=Ochotona princeps TaxID=9978 RepID=UPI0027153AAF|nr:uncharacterized protein C7orf50 homolog [Ochotona princeps]
MRGAACLEAEPAEAGVGAPRGRMTKQKRKVPGGPEKKSKSRKKACMEEEPRAPEAGPDVQDANPTLTPEQKRVLERKLKKERKKEERKRLRAAGQAAQAPLAQRSGAELALDYLSGWAQKQAGWRFQKTRQTWLLQHMFDQDKVPDKHFPTLLAYLEGLQGRARELTVLKAEALMRELDAADNIRDSPGKAQRLRQVLQLLS